MLSVLLQALNRTIEVAADITDSQEPQNFLLGQFLEILVGYGDWAA